MRARLLPLILAATAALAFAAPANASFLTGIAENQPEMFDSPLFPHLGVKHARLVVSYDMMTRRDDEFVKALAYVAKADARGVDVLVQFEHLRGDSTRCNKRSNFSKPVCKAPTAAVYTKNLKAFVAAFPTVKLIGPWNEINHYSQPTSRNPKLAATYAKIAAKVCKGCKIVVADILDQADNVKAKRPTFKATGKYIKAFRKAYGKRLGICGLHNYSDTNRFRNTGTKALIKLMGCKQYWLTETGGQLKTPSFRSADENRQLKATKYMFKIAAQFKQIKRVYNYSYFGRETVRFDAGLVDQDTGQPRKSYFEVQRHAGGS